MFYIKERKGGEKWKGRGGGAVDEIKGSKASAPSMLMRVCEFGTWLEWGITRMIVETQIENEKRQKSILALSAISFSSDPDFAARSHAHREPP